MTHGSSGGRRKMAGKWGNHVDTARKMNPCRKRIVIDRFASALGLSPFPFPSSFRIMLQTTFQINFLAIKVMHGTEGRDIVMLTFPSIWPFGITFSSRVTGPGSCFFFSRFLGGRSSAHGVLRPIGAPYATMVSREWHNKRIYHQLFSFG